jgi:DNA replication protein DnaC
VTAAIDILSYRYDEQLCTLATTNLGAEDIETYYDGRIKDRFREMMLIVNFKDENSFR